MTVFDAIGRRLLFTLEPERAHELSIQGLRSGVPLCRRPAADPRLRVMVAGIGFENPIGMAAGFDKNAEVPDALLGLGFGFAEVGTITPRPQPGNPRPRVFRLERDRAVINRLGFNNEGHAAALARLSARARKGGVVGVNVGANKESEDRVADYVAGVRAFAPHASYLTVNISSPNTPGLRDLQERESLSVLLEAVIAARNASGCKVPLFLKIAPDLSPEQMEDIAAVVIEKGVEGLIVSNTTLGRKGLKSSKAREAGGLSGRPLFNRSTIVLARMRKLVGHKLPIIGVGGVDSDETAAEKIRAGADLVQLYTGLIFGGPSLPGQIVRGLSRILDREKLERLADLRDSRVDEWAARPLD
ncbi:quinone-dependent dihydroorotate dehydrogenase [Chelativorans sp. ZYF759]|uniref:quinone-dependent dihydroorotate dehydrogenase n=1 Tax=Chelativorans sp. ZYF759 TaxID=2692213 RepID=UPI00145F9569|nr:quinone-dependent dihydroorotate dehydrogenase [Chelativorans sp. ZYF759]